MRYFLFAAALVALPAAARAEAPQVGARMIATSAIICDTRDQVMSLYSGSKADDGRGILPVYERFHQTVDSRGEPACNIQPLFGALIEAVDDLGESRDPTGKTIHAWAIRLSTDNSGRSDWALYGEAKSAEAPGLAI